MDEGAGLPAAGKPEVFETFTRIEGSDRAKTGTGLGLAIVKGFAEAMGLRVEAANRTARIGASFNLRFPRALLVRPLDEDQSMTSDPVILVVDDEPAIRRLLRGALERASYHVSEAATAAALAMVASRRPGARAARSGPARSRRAGTDPAHPQAVARDESWSSRPAMRPTRR